MADLVHARGGIVSAAHLKWHGTKVTLAALQLDGLDAVETRHPSHDGETRATITEAAAALGLARSGGSDWHAEFGAGGGCLDETVERVVVRQGHGAEADPGGVLHDLGGRQMPVGGRGVAVEINHVWP